MLRYTMLLTWCLVVLPSAQESMYLIGKVLDSETGVCIVGAVVAMKKNARRVGAVVSDTAGDYVLRVYPVSDYTITVLHPYYETTDIRCRFVRPDTWNIDFLLKPRTDIDEEYGIITGIVTDATTHDPLIGADITFWGMQLGASTVINGGYIVDKVPIGSHLLSASFIGYQPVTDSAVTVLPGKTTVHNFQLSRYQVEIK